MNEPDCGTLRSGRALLPGALLLWGLVAAPAASQSPVPVPSGLVAWWPLDGSGADLGPNALDGAPAGSGVGYQPAEVGPGMRPVQPDGHLSVPDADVLDLRSFTIECWLEVDGLRAGHSYIVSKGGASHVDTPYALGLVRSSGTLPTTGGASVSGSSAPGRPFVTVSDGSLEQVVIANSAVPFGRPFHLAVTIGRVGTARQASIYLDGQLAGGAFLSRRSFTGTDPLQIGGIAGGADNTLDGFVDEVSLYDRRLEAAEIQAIFAAGPAGKQKPFFDDTPPVVAISAPAEGQVLGSPLVAVTAGIADESATVVTSQPSGVSVSLPAGGGTASGSVALPGDGVHTIVIDATDEAGNSAASSVSVVVDSTPPSGRVLSPASGSVVGSSPVALAIEVGDATATSLDAGGAGGSLPAGGGTLALQVPLVAGSNDVRIAVTDAAGNRTELVQSLVLDVASPLVSILTPAHGTLLGAGASGAAVTVRVDDLSATHLVTRPAGLSADLPAGGGLASGVVPLQEGLNDITAIATDEVGRQGSATVTVNLDTTPPGVAFAEPAAGELLRGVVEVRADALDVAPGSGIASLELQVDGNATGSAAGPQLVASLDTTALTDGDHLLQVIALDGAGNRATASLSVSVDNLAPDITILEPVAGAVHGRVAFVGLVSDSGSGVVSVRQRVGGGAPSIDGSVVLATPTASLQVNGEEDTTSRPNGPLSFEIEASDRAGNVARVEVVAEVQNTTLEPPGLSPRDGARVHGVVHLRVVSPEPDVESIELMVDGQPLAKGSHSPLCARFDSRSRLDGPLEVHAVVRTARGIAEVTHTLQVDNLRLVGFAPGQLDLTSSRRGPDVLALVVGPNAGLLANAGRLELRLPGGSPVVAEGVRGCRWLRFLAWVRFDRAEVRAALRGAVASQSRGRGRGSVRASVVADGHALGSARLRWSNHRGCRGRR